MSTSVFQPGYLFADRYKVRKAIAEGGMAKIFTARDQKIQRDVAIKRLNPYFMANAIVRKRFISEGKIQQFLVHPNIVRVFEITERPMLAIVMEWVEGPTLDAYLQKKEKLDESEVLELIIPILSAIGFAHKKGIIHRDIKPSNILIAKTKMGYTPKIMDFGVAKIKGGDQSLTATGTTVGTLHYMSPEQIVGSKNIDGRADIYSLGVTLYKLMTGKVPFNAPTEFALMMAQVEAAPLPPSQLRPDMSKDIERIILKALAKRASERFQTISEFTNALLSAKFSTPSHTQNTITNRIPVDILQYAIDADFVGKDRSQELNLQTLEDLPFVEFVDTQSLTQKIKLDFQDPTVEISPLDLLEISSQDIPNEKTSQYFKSEEEAAIADTVALDAHVNLISKARIIFDHSESRDLTAPKISQEAYDLVMRNVDQISDAETLEKPKLRTINPGLFVTSQDLSDAKPKQISKPFPEPKLSQPLPVSISIPAPSEIPKGIQHQAPTIKPNFSDIKDQNPKHQIASSLPSNLNSFHLPVKKENNIDVKFIFMIAVALSVVIVAFAFLLFTLLF